MERLLTERERHAFCCRKSIKLTRLKHACFALFLHSWLLTSLLPVVPEEKKAKHCELSSSRNSNPSFSVSNQN